jgi:hypothetical protein
MSSRRIGPAVIVGIDGSQAAIYAAEWAADEALGCGVPLLMLAIIKATHPSAEDYHRDVAHAETSLEAARVAAEAMGRPVKVETELAGADRPADNHRLYDMHQRDGFMTHGCFTRRPGYGGIRFSRSVERRPACRILLRLATSRAPLIMTDWA